MIMEKELLKEIASYFKKSAVDGNWYFRNGFSFFSQKLVVKLMKWAGPDLPPPCPYGIKWEGCTGNKGPWCGYCQEEIG